MRIVSVDTMPVSVPGAAPSFQWRAGLPGSPGERQGAVLTISTDEGHTGYAFDPHGTIVADLVDRVIGPDLIGIDAMSREYLWHRIWELDRIEALPTYALGLVDVALWDLASRAMGLPAYQLMGAYRDAIPAYASTSTFGSVAEYLDVADQCLALGFKAIKVHAWGDARRDARLCEALREHVGDEVGLMYDGSAGFDLPDAIYLGRSLSDAAYTWYEEPMREFSIGAYRRLSERVSVPLLVAETSSGAHFNTADFIAAGTATHVRTSARYKGGFTGALRIAHLAEANLLRAEVHGDGIESRHLCMAIPNNTYYESFVTSSEVHREDAVDDHGMVAAPTEPGVGLPDFIRKQLPTGRTLA